MAGRPGRYRVVRAVATLLLLFALGACRTESPLAVATIDGGCAASSSPYLGADGLPAMARISYCDGGDAATDTIVTSVFPAGTSRLDAAIAGYPDGMAVRLEAVPESGGAAVVLDVPRAGDRWQAVAIEIPADIATSSFRLRLVDVSSETFGWAGFGLGLGATPASAIAVPALAMLSILLAAHAWLCLVAWSLPADWAAARRIVGAMLALGMASTAAFFIQIALPAVGGATALLLLAAPLAVIGFRRPGSLAAWRVPVQLGAVALPSMVLAALVLWIGLYPLQWSGQDWTVPASRWLDLPMDNWLPQVLGEMALRGVVDQPMIGDWLSSDRPPLQSGLYLVFRNLWPSSPGLLYQAIATWAQMLVLVPVALLVGDIRSRSVRATMVMCVGLSALVIVNGLFVWPKLLAAAYCAIFHMALFPPGARRAQSTLVAGVACALAMLAHGGALFALAGSAGAYVLARRSGWWKTLWRSIAIGLVLYAPWIMYQRLVDPPGDRLLKWHFAGQIAITPTSAPQALIDAYARIPFQQWLEGRWANLGTVTQGTWKFFVDAREFILHPGNGDVAPTLVGSSFFHLFYSMWFFSPLLLLPLLAWQLTYGRRSAGPLPGGLAASFLVGIALWLLVMFSPASTLIHQGAYLSVLALQLVIMALCAHASRPLFFVIAGLNIYLAFALYAFDRDLHHVVHPLLYVTVALALGCMFAVACLRGQSDASCHNRHLPQGRTP